LTLRQYQAQLHAVLWQKTIYAFDGLLEFVVKAELITSSNLLGERNDKLQ